MLATSSPNPNPWPLKRRRRRRRQRVAWAGCSTLLLAGLMSGAPDNAAAVLGGSYMKGGSAFETNPFRGAVMSGGGTGIVLFADGDEAVVLTVAHGYDLSSKSAKEAMDAKLNDGGLRLALGTTGVGGYATSAGSDSIIAKNLGLWRHFTFQDPETCPLFNAAQHSGELDDPFGCDGIGPDIDLALHRVRLTPAAVAMDLPEIGLGFDPIKPGQPMTLVGFGMQSPCDWDGMSAADRQWRGEMGDALKIAQNSARATFFSEVFTEGTSTVSPQAQREDFGCVPGSSVAECGKLRGAVEADADFGDRWGTGCAGDSGAPWLSRSAATGKWSVVGVNRGPGKAADPNDSKGWLLDDDRTFLDGICGGTFDACQSTGTAIATIYPMRRRIKDALAAWNPAWASKASYQCEPPSLVAGTCGAGCQLCTKGGTADCFPAAPAFQCSDFDALPGTDRYICGEALSTKTPPKRECPASKPCRALTAGMGMAQRQVCMEGTSAGCPGLTVCCGEGCTNAANDPSKVAWPAWLDASTGSNGNGNGSGSSGSSDGNCPNPDCGVAKRGRRKLQ